MEVQITFLDAKGSPFVWHCFTAKKETNNALVEALYAFENENRRSKIKPIITMIVFPENF